MDKYVQYALTTIKYKIFKQSVSEENMIQEASTLEEVLIIKQDYNYTIDQYYVALVGSTIESITFDQKTYTEKEENAAVDSQASIIIPIEYSKKADTLIIELQGGILDPITISVQYEDTDRSRFDQECQEELNKKIRLNITKGINLINVSWELVSKSISQVEVSLYQNGSDKLGNFKRCIWCSTFDSNHFPCFTAITNLGQARYILEINEHGNGEIVATQSVAFELEDLFKKLKEIESASYATANTISTRGRY